jgi:hypothetical protein
MMLPDPENQTTSRLTMQLSDNPKNRHSSLLAPKYRMTGYMFVHAVALTHTRGCFPTAQEEEGRIFQGNLHRTKALAFGALTSIT